MLDKQLGDINSLTLDNQRVLIREDFNVPLQDGNIADDTRIKRALPTINSALTGGAAVIIASHFGRPQEGKFEAQYSLAPVAKRLSELLGQTVKLVNDWQQGCSVKRGEVVLLENMRFNSGEKANSPELAQQLAALCDIFVMDAFASAHRAHASTVGVAQFAKIAVAGPLLLAELHSLSAALDQPARPLVAIVGGAKVSTKIQLLDTLIDKVDQLIVGGGIANTFLKAQGHAIGKSLHEADWVEPAKQLLQRAAAKNVAIPLPVDVVVASSLTPAATTHIKTLDTINENEAIYDVGPKTQASYHDLFNHAKTIVWNGPVGVFEIEAFSGGTKAMAQAIAASHAFSLAGGGDTVAALTKFAVSDQISYVSTGGGAFLEYLEGRALPALKVLQHD